MTRLSDLVACEGYGFRVVPEPWREARVQGDPPDPHLMSALLCLDGDGAPYVACVADCLDHVYAASHEIAEHVSGFRHTETMERQANLLASWVRRAAEPGAQSPQTVRPAPFTHPYRLLTLSVLLGAATGAFIGWWAGGRKQ